MDYSVVEEHPEGSPWATSPQPTRTTFQAPESPDIPPTRPEHQSEPSFSQEARLEHPPDQSQSQQQPPPNDAPASENAPQKAPTQKRKERPSYKLQAKITSLERNGRKDPILKFDVYVCCYYSLVRARLIIRIDQSTQVSNNSIS
jgi:hypothetical protein